MTHLKEPEDAVRLSSWAAIQAALGRLDHQRSNSIVAACREFRRAWAEAARFKGEKARITAHMDALDRFFRAEETGDRAGQRAALADMARILEELHDEH